MSGTSCRKRILAHGNGQYGRTAAVKSSLASQVTEAIEDLVPVAVAMLPVNAAVYVLDGCLVGASDFKYLAGAPLLPYCHAVKIT
jgi:hypothetical protein